MDKLVVTAFILLTRPDGLAMYVSTEHIVSVSAPAAGASSPNAQSEITLDSGTKVYVRENPGAVIDHVRHD